jgi:hypothetical protein
MTELAALTNRVRGVMPASTEDRSRRIRPAFDVEEALAGRDGDVAGMQFHPSASPTERLFAEGPNPMQ